MTMVVSKKCRPAAGRPRWVLAVALIGALWCATGEPVRAQQSGDYVLRAPAALVQDIAARHGLTVIKQLDGQDVFLVHKSDTVTSFSRLTSLSVGVSQSATGDVEADPDVVHFEPNAVVVTPEVASAFTLNGSAVSILDLLSDRSLVNFFNIQVWNHYVNQPATVAIQLAASRQAAGSGTGIVAIIDTGVDPTHPVLAGSLVPGYDFVHEIAGTASEWSDLDGSAVSILDGSAVSILDSSSVVSLNGSAVAILDQATASALDPAQLPRAFGHGTMVAGLVHLVAPTARIMPLKAFSADGTSTVFDVVRAIYYAVDNGARVINMSFSATASSPEMASAINYATSHGVICLASAGNLGKETLVYPGALRNVVGVGSTTSIEPPAPSSFTNYGDALVSLGAPGEAVITTYPGGHYAGVWGTSFSTPLAAGGAALLLQVDPTLNQAKAAELLGKAETMPAGMGMGKGRLNLFQAVQSESDATPPTVSIETPVSGVLSGTVLVSASASDNIGVAGVKFLLDGSPISAEDTAAPYELMWTTGTASNGAHTLTAIARDATGNQTTSASVSVTVSNDTTAPTVVLTSPAAGSNLAGTVTLTATATDDVDLVGVQFVVDGASLGAEETAAPYGLPWITTSVPNGIHMVTAVARDAAGHQTTAASVGVMVSNDSTAPTVALTNPTMASTVTGTITLNATAADDVGVVGVQFKLDGVPFGAEDTVAPYGLAWLTTGVPNGIHTVTAVARDLAGHQTTAQSVTVMVSNDTTAPTVAMTSPAPASLAAATVTLAATATDDVGVAAVQFELDGAPLGAEATVAPYQLGWLTTGVPNGIHTVTAVARDAAGNQTTATGVMVMVNNDNTPPTVALTTPATSSVVAGAVMLTAMATDDVGVVGVQFELDGAPLGPENTVAPYQLAWLSTNVPDGVHTVYAVARDAAGHQTAASAQIMVLNGTTGP